MNFRNYERRSLCFDPETNVLFGDNAQGKDKMCLREFISVLRPVPTRGAKTGR